MKFVTPPEDSPFIKSTPEHIKWSIAKPASAQALSILEKRQEILAHSIMSPAVLVNGSSDNNHHPLDSETNNNRGEINEEDEGNGPKSARIPCEK